MTCLSKIKTKTQQFQDQDQDQDFDVQDQLRPRLKTYKTNTGSRRLGWTVINKKTEKVMASRKSSIPVVAHSKQQNIIPYLINNSVLIRKLPLIIAVYQTLARTHNISKVGLRCLIDD